MPVCAQTDSQHQGCVMGYWDSGLSWKILTFDFQARLIVIFFLFISFFIFGFKEVH